MPPRSILCLCVLLTTTVVGHAAPQFPPGSGVGLEPPPGMSVATDFRGFQRGPASIVIVEMPAAAFAQVDAKRGLFAAKIDGARVEDATVNGLHGFIVRGRQAAGLRVYRKWALVLGAPQETTLVTAQVPEDDTAVSDADVERALRSVVVGRQPSVADQVAALPFTVGDPAGFRQVGDALVGASLGFTEGPKDVDPDNVQPHVVVGTSLNHPPAANDRLAFAEAVLRSLTALKGVEVKSANLFEADGAQWAEIKGSAKRGRAATTVHVDFFLRFGEGDFLVIVGTAPPGTDDDARFRRLALSVRPKS